MELTLKNYIEDAKKNISKEYPAIGTVSDRDLSEMLGLNPTAVNQWVKRESYPSDDTMVRLSCLAQIDPAVGLLDLNIWRSNGLSKNSYKIIRKYMSCFAELAKKEGREIVKVGTALCFIMLIFATPANAKNSGVDLLHYRNDTVYYGKFKRFFRFLMLNLKNA